MLTKKTFANAHSRGVLTLMRARERARKHARTHTHTHSKKEVTTLGAHHIYLLYSAVSVTSLLSISFLFRTHSLQMSRNVWRYRVLML